MNAKVDFMMKMNKNTGDREAIARTTELAREVRELMEDFGAVEIVSACTGEVIELKEFGRFLGILEGFQNSDFWTMQ